MLQQISIYKTNSGYYLFIAPAYLLYITEATEFRWKYINEILDPLFSLNRTLSWNN